MDEATRSRSRGQELERLRRALAEADARAEEVAAYYRGELEAARRRADEEAIRVQAEEAGRRRRVEEQAARLGSELEAARRDTEHAQRRYEELRRRLDDLPQDGAGRADAWAEEREAARAAWRTAEEEVARLDTELEALQRTLDAERTQWREQAREHECASAAHQHTEERWRRLMSRLRHGFKASEQRRKALEAALAEARSEGGAEWRRGLDPADARVEVDPATGWGGLAVGAGDDLCEEFRLVETDRSICEEWATPTDQPDTASSEVSTEEAEALLMELDVDRRMAQRRADAGKVPPADAESRGVAAAPDFGGRAPRAAPPAPRTSATRAGARSNPGSGKLLSWLVVAGAAGVIVVVGTLLLL